MDKAATERALRTSLKKVLEHQNFTYARKGRKGWYRNILGDIDVGVWPQVESVSRSYTLDAWNSDDLNAVRVEVGFGPRGRYLYNVAGLENTMRYPYEHLGREERRLIAQVSMTRVSTCAESIGMELTPDFVSFLNVTTAAHDAFYPVVDPSDVDNWVRKIARPLEAVIHEVESVATRNA
jgi:hypothetical protein